MSCQKNQGTVDWLATMKEFDTLSGMKNCQSVLGRNHYFDPEYIRKNTKLEVHKVIQEVGDLVLIFGAVHQGNGWVCVFGLKCNLLILL